MEKKMGYMQANKSLPRRMIALTVFAVLLAGLPLQAIARGRFGASSGLEPARVPETVGMSSERLARVDALLQGWVDRGEIAGVTAMIGRKGKIVYLKAFGHADIGSGTEMETDSLFRICSMTKAITSVAVMMLYEEGHFRLSEPVSQYIPEFADMQVLVPEEDTYRLEPARNPITIRDLLTHTSGLSYVFLGYPFITDLYLEAGIHDGLGQSDGEIGDMVKKISEMPLWNHPGEAWNYSLSYDVLGYFIEVISGMPFDQFLEERLFGPLGMEDTFFYVPDEEKSRLASLYAPSPEGLAKYPEEAVTVGTVVVNPANCCAEGDRSYFSGGAGLVSTAADYGRFCQMLLNGGELDGARILSPTTVEIMIANQIGELTITWPDFGDKFGLGFAIRTERGGSDESESIGTYGWIGLYDTAFWIDPEEQMFGVLMKQLFPHGNEMLNFNILAHQAIID
jgi:CubicO group peptidase (beta-lactamase class C family)